MFGFARLEVWHKAVEYAGTIYDVTRTFPEEERFGLTSQLLESVSELRIAEKQKFISHSDLERIYKQAEELAKMLSGLRRTIKLNVNSKALNTKLSTLNLD